LDHHVSLSSLGVEVYVPMRVVQNGVNGSEVIITLFYATEEQFDQDMRMVEQDLKNLKSIIEEATP
jgi:hypothetical protein